MATPSSTTDHLRVDSLTPLRPELIRATADATPESMRERSAPSRKEALPGRVRTPAAAKARRRSRPDRGGGRAEVPEGGPEVAQKKARRPWGERPPGTNSE